MTDASTASSWQAPTIRKAKHSRQLMVATSWLPRNGPPYRWTVLPFFETRTSLLIVAVFTAGLTMVIEHVL
ncbi:hypothetical protein ACWAT4_24960 [Bradyrhizobium manausense]